MRDVARAGLAALALCLALGTPAALAQGTAGSGWTDPPARKADPARPEPAEPGPGKTAPDAPRAALPPPATPAAASKAAERSPRPHRTAVVRRERPRIAAVPSRPRSVRAEPGRLRPPARVAQARPPRIVTAMPSDAPIYVRPYGYGPGYVDERLERLNSAVAAGYLVMRRRSVAFPDGRTLRVYQPAEDDEPF